MRRRPVLFSGTAWLAGLGGPARAQKPATRIGLLWFVGNRSEDFDAALRELGYAEGRNVVVDLRSAQGRADRLEELARELVGLGAAVIVAGGPAPLAAARRVTQSVPIVAVGGSDPVAEGWARSLAQPGGNVTGLTVTHPELGIKQLELLKETLPPIARVALVFAGAELADRDGLLSAYGRGAQQLGLRLLQLDIRGADDIEPGFERLQRDGAQALAALATNTVVAHRQRLAELATRQRLLSISDFALMARTGFVMTYGANLGDLVRRSAVYVDKILRGARPGDLPIERPARFEFVVNAAAARAIGIAIPRSLLLRADEVIE